MNARDGTAEAVIHAQVLVVGAGPVGLTLAIDLARRGVQVLVVEQRARGERPAPKCNHVSAHTMEIFRRLGFADAVRAAGLPDEHPHDVAHRTAFTGAELSRIEIPSRQGRRRPHQSPDADWPTPEPPHRVNQIYLEPVLQAQAAAQPGLQLLHRVRLLALEQDANGCQAIALRIDDGVRLRIRCRYLVGCDGPRSTVRRALGIRFVGAPGFGRVHSLWLRAPGLRALERHAPAWATLIYQPQRCASVYAIDGHETFVLHRYLPPGEPPGLEDDAPVRALLGVDADFEYQVLGREDWTARRLVAERFADRRVLLCGDAAHVWVPMAGYGMNAGIADAATLAWLLAGRLRGWLHDQALQAYDTERRPITEQVSQFAMDHALALQRERATVPPGLDAPGPEGAARRLAFGRVLHALNLRQYACAGLNFGSHCAGSPLVSDDDETLPAYTMDRYTPSTVPGCRTPHLWLPGARSLYDAHGDDHALLRFDPRAEVAPIVAAARRRSMPMRVVDVDTAGAITPYRHALLLSRPDRIVAWRGDRPPHDALALIDRLRGCTVAASLPIRSESTSS